MASLFSFAEDNGAAAGSPPTGTRTMGRTECNWKNVDDSTTAYSSSPITAGNNSFVKYQYGMISGTWNQILNGLFGHTTGTLGAGLTLRLMTGALTTGYQTPNTTTLSSGVDATLAGTIATSGTGVKFSDKGPQSGTGATLNTFVNTGYTCYLITQLQTTTGASPGDIASQTLTLQYDENVLIGWLIPAAIAGIGLLTSLANLIV